MASPTHYGNLTDPGYSMVGIAVVSSGGTLYVVEDFQEVAGWSPPIAADPEPAPRPAERRAVAPPEPEPGPPVAAEPPPPIAAPEPPAPAASSYGFVLEALRALDDHHAHR